MKSVTVCYFAVLIALIHAQIRLDLHHVLHNDDESSFVKQRLLAGDELGVTNYNNVQYYTNIKVGSNDQTMTVILDTGSAWLWMQAAGRTSDTFNFGSHKYNCSASTTCNQTNMKANTSYTKGGIYGRLTYDSVNLGDGYVVKKQGFNLVHKTVNFGNIKADGFWGLTHNNPSSPKNVPNLMDNLKSQGIISKKTFALYLTDDFTGTSTGSSMIIGGHDSALMDEPDFSNIYIKQNYKYWTIGIQGFSLGNTNFNMESPHTIMDCGANYMDVADVDWPKILKAIRSVDSDCDVMSNGLVGCPCPGNNDYAKFPKMTWDLGNSTIHKEFSLTADQYIRVTNNVCILGIRNKSGSVTRLGVQFMKHFYLNFDMDKMLIGFAKVKR
jgi:hypothetical protein